MGIFSTERGPSNLTLKHNRAKTPPVTVMRVAMTAEDLRGNVVWSTNSRISHESSGLSPVIDNATVADSEVDLVEVYGIAICRSVGLSLKKALVVRVIVELMETSGKTEISQFNMTASIKQDVVRFNITAIVSHIALSGQTPHHAKRALGEREFLGWPTDE